jgi:hypothetical protein
MSSGSDAAGLAALAICEAILLSLTDNAIIDQAEAQAILTDAATAHRGAALLSDGESRKHEQVAVLIEAIRDGGNAVRRTRSASTDGDGSDEQGMA